MSRSAIEKCAEDATFQVTCAMQHIEWLRVTLRVLKDRLDKDDALEAYAKLAELAIYNADGWHYDLDVEREGFEAVLKEAGWVV